MEHKFKVGDRVMLSGHWEFPDGVIGTVVKPDEGLVELTSPGEWVGHTRTAKGPKGPIYFYFISFDKPADDGSGDGFYNAAEIDDESLVPFS